MREIKKPAFMQEAAVRPGHPWVMEILICIVVYVAGSMVAGIGQMPGMMAYLLQNRDYLQMMRTGNVDMELVMKLMQNMPEWLTIFMLFTEVFLILVYMLYCRYVEKRKFSTMGFMGKGAFIQYVKGILIGAVAFAGTYLLCLVTGSVQFGGIAANVVPTYILLYFFGYMIQGMAEEVICRGFLMVSLSRKYSIWFSAIISSLLFMSLHFANAGMTLLSMVNLFLFGMFMALLFTWSGNIWVVGAVHSIWNFLQGNIFGVQVSGLAKQNSVFQTSFADGKSMINGGSFGMEGGLAVTIVLVVGIGLVYSRMKKEDMVAEVPSVTDDSGKKEFLGEQPMQQNTSGDAGDFRVYRNNPSVFTETPWTPERAKQKMEQSMSGTKSDNTPESFQDVFASRDGETVQTVFNADYFRDGEDEIDY